MIKRGLDERGIGESFIILFAATLDTSGTSTVLEQMTIIV